MKNIDSQLDDVWSRIVKLSNPFCWFPGCHRQSTDACHVFNRRHHGTRWDLRNGLGGCREHHNWEETHKTEAKPLIVAKIGEEAYNEIEHLARMVCKHSESDKRDILTVLKGILDKLNKTS